MKNQKSDSKDGKYSLPTLEELLEAGVHFGHQSKRWHPRIAPYLYKEQNKIHIFDLLKTHQKLTEACQYLYEQAKEGKTICFVGTKKQASEIVKREAERAGAFYIAERWTGGMITNFDHVRNKMLRLKKIEEGLAPFGQYEAYTKKERLDLEREAEKLITEVGGVRELNQIPDILFVIDIKREATAVTEAHNRGVVVVALVDSNCDPTLVDFPVPGNDDASRAIEIITAAVANAVAAGYQEAGINFQKTVKAKPKSVVVEKKPEVEGQAADIGEGKKEAEEKIAAPQAAVSQAQAKRRTAAKKAPRSTGAKKVKKPGRPKKVK